VNATNTSASEQPVDERSLSAGIRQAYGWALMFGAGELSFALFAAHLQVPLFFFGLLTGIPMLLGPLAQALAADLLDRRPNRKRMVLDSVLSQTLCFAPLVLLAFLPSGPVAYGVFLLAVTVYFVSGQFGTPPWSSMISVLVPASRWAHYFARQNRAISLMGLVTQLAMGGALYLAGRFASPGSAQRVLAWVFAGAFCVAGLARFWSFLEIKRMNDPPYEVPPDSVFTFWQFIRRVRESNFVHFVLFTALITFGTYLAGPYFLPYWKYDLKYTSWQWVAMSSAGTLASIWTLIFWGRFSHRFGNKKSLGYTSLCISFIPVAWMVSANFYYLVAVNFFSGMVWAGFTLSSWNYILEAVTPPKRARCVAYFNLFVGAAAFLGSLAGGWIAPHLPAFEVAPGVGSRFWNLLLLSATVRFLVWLLFLPTFRELREVERFSLREHIYRIAQGRYPVGIIFDFFSGEKDD
jgi:MFS family permease